MLWKSNRKVITQDSDLTESSQPHAALKTVTWQGAQRLRRGMLHLRNRRKAAWLRHEEEVREHQEVESER